jgi:hypothetical protein
MGVVYCIGPLDTQKNACNTARVFVFDSRLCWSIRGQLFECVMSMGAEK